MHTRQGFLNQMCTRQLLIVAGVRKSVCCYVLLCAVDGAQDDSQLLMVDGYNCLHWAVENGDLEMVQLLLNHNLNVNAAAAFEKHSGVTALHLASQVSTRSTFVGLMPLSHFCSSSCSSLRFYKYFCRRKVVHTAWLSLESVFLFFGCMIYLHVHVCFVLPWSVESFPFMFWRWRNKLK